LKGKEEIDDKSVVIAEKFPAPHTRESKLISCG